MSRWTRILIKRTKDMSTDKSNKKETANGLYILLTAGQLVELDKGNIDSMFVRVVKQTPTRIYTTVKCDYDGDIWRVKTNRLTPCG